MKKFFSCLLCALFVCALFPLQTGAAVSGLYYYRISDGSAEIFRVKPEAEGEVAVPEILGGYAVAAIDRGAFSEIDQITAVVLPESLKTIGDGVFSDCTALREVTMADGVTEMGESVFSGCESLERVTLSAGLSEIRQKAFFGCESLREVEIPAGVIAIGTQAFEGCAGLTELWIPRNVSEIGDRAFYGCGLEKIGADIQNAALYAENNCLIRSADHNLLVGCAGSEIPRDGSVRVISEYAFSGSGLTEVEIPDSVYSIGNYAFADCKQLALVTVPASVSYMGRSVFSGCPSLRAVTFAERSLWDQFADRFDGGAPFLLVHDLDADGVLTVGDCTLVRAALLGLEDEIGLAADFNADGFVDVADLALYTLKITL